MDNKGHTFFLKIYRKDKAIMKYLSGSLEMSGNIGQICKSFQMKGVCSMLKGKGCRGQGDVTILTPETSVYVPSQMDGW